MARSVRASQLTSTAAAAHYKTPIARQYHHVAGASRGVVVLCNHAPSAHPTTVQCNHDPSAFARLMAPPRNLPWAFARLMAPLRKHLPSALACLMTPLRNLPSALAHAAAALCNEVPPVFVRALVPLYCRFPPLSSRRPTLSPLMTRRHQARAPSSFWILPVPLRYARCRCRCPLRLTDRRRRRRSLLRRVRRQPQALRTPSEPP